MRRFWAGYNLVENSNFSKHFYGPRYQPLGYLPLKSQRQNSSQRQIFRLKMRPFLAQKHIIRHFGPFCTRIYIIFTAFLGSKKKQKKKKYGVMQQTLCRAYRDSDRTSKGKDTSKSYKEVTREHEWSQLIPYFYNLKGQQSSIQKAEKQHSKRQKIGFEGHV